MLRFSLMGIPVGVDWWFWLVSAMLGSTGGASWQQILIWVVVVFISVLVHEFGHALAGRQFGADPAIRLHGMGGVTYLPGGYFSRPQHIWVSAAGPLAGLFLGFVAVLVIRAFPMLPPLVMEGLHDAVYIGFFWTAVNLLPIQPMDGGQILRDVLGPSRHQATCIIGFVCGLSVAAIAFMVHWYLMALMLGYMAWLNLKGSRLDGGVVTR